MKRWIEPNKLIIDARRQDIMARYLCEACNVELESRSVHDFVLCPGTNKGPCENETFVDGGNEYNRCGGKELGKIAIIDRIEVGTGQSTDRWPY